MIEHLKSDHRMGRCHLKGLLRDELHAVLFAAGYNMRWLLRMIAKSGLRACGRSGPWGRQRYGASNDPLSVR